jgi:hypothetical protein
MDMQSFFAPLVQALQAAHQQGWDGRAEAMPWSFERAKRHSEKLKRSRVRGATAD